jgi:hypothetical protein
MSSIKDKIIFVFNKYFFEFIEDVLESNPTLQELNTFCKVQNLQTTKHIVQFTEQINKDEVIKTIYKTPYTDLLNLESIQNLVIGNISVKEFITNIDDKDSFLYYIYIFTLFSALFEHTDEDEQSTLFELYVSSMNSIQKGQDLDLSTIYDKNIKSLLENIKAVKSCYADTGSDETSEFMDNAADILTNTKIGALAQEISKDIDISSLNIQKPEDILNVGNMFNGNSPISDIIGKVGTKIHEKISSGELKQEDLMSEALGMLKMFNKNGNNPLFNNPMMQEMMKNMGGGGKNSKVQVNTNQVRVQTKRSELKQKLLDRQNK